MDQDGQLTFADDPKALKLNSATNHLRLGQFDHAAVAFGELFETEPDYPGVTTGIRTARFWANRMEHISGMEQGLEKGRFLKDEWNAFEDFLGEPDTDSQLPIQAVRTYIFTEAIHSFTRAYQETVAPDIHLIYDIGECYLNIRDYEKAIETFEYAWELQRDNSRILARLADACYALGDEHDLRREDRGLHKKARLLFREAFLYEPTEIEIQRLRAPFIQALVQTVSGAGFVGKEIAAWVPIYAAIGHEFNIKRELEEHEVQRLSEQVHGLERQLSKAGGEVRILLPALLNRYIWLIDHYLIEKNDSLKVEILKKKFHDADPEMFERIFHHENQREYPR